MILVVRCDGRTRCSLTVNDATFGGADPCPNTGKYLEIIYLCIPGTMYLCPLFERLFARWTCVSRFPSVNFHLCFRINDSEIGGTAFYGPDSLPVTKSIARKHSRIYNAVTQQMALLCSLPSPTNGWSVSPHNTGRVSRRSKKIQF